MKRSLLQSCALAAALAFAAPALAADPPASGAAATTQQSTQIDAQKLIGQTVKNNADESIGKVDSVILDKDGKTAAVVVGVGGFLGMGEHNVALPWSSLRIANGGRDVHANFTKDQLKAMPEYKYADASRRGTAFRDEGYRVSQADRSDMTRPMDRDTRSDASRSTSQTTASNWSAIGSTGEIRASKLVGTDVVNSAGEKIGDVSEVIVGRGGQPQAIVSVGGFLGMGEHRVAIDWSKLKIERQGNSDRMRVVLDMSKDQLKAMPDYKFENQRS
jgi:sporulation protein YlmC with PRC-barrel domain